MEQQCTYYCGLKKDGRKTFIRCGNNSLMYADENEPVRPPEFPFFTTEKCLYEKGESPYDCRAFLVRSIQAKKCNVASDHTIPELQEIYERVKSRPSCEGCEYLWWSAGYNNAAAPSEATGFEGWKEWESRKIPCECFTNYCRPDYKTLIKITDDELTFCNRTQRQEQEETPMPKKGIIPATTPTAITEARDPALIAAEVRFYKNQAGEAIIEIGQRLTEAKEQLQHGAWLVWLEKEVVFSERDAQRFMQLAREYSNPTLVSDLGYSKALVLLALPTGERESFAEENNAVNMTRRELDTAIKERNAAREAQAVAETASAEAKRREEAAAAALRLAEDKAIEVATIAADARAEKETLEAELRKLRNKADQPVEPDQTVIDGIRKEAEAAAKKAAEDKLKKKIADADAKKAEADKAVADAQAEFERVKQEAEAEKKAAEERAAAAEKKLAVASSETMTIFKTHFESVQSPLNSMLGCIKKLEDDTATRDKLAMALRTLCEKTIAGLPVAEGSADA